MTLARLWFRVRMVPTIYALLWECAFTGGPFDKDSVRFEARVKLIGIHAFAILTAAAIDAWLR